MLHLEAHSVPSFHFQKNNYEEENRHLPLSPTDCDGSMVVSIFNTINFKDQEHILEKEGPVNMPI